MIKLFVTSVIVVQCSVFCWLDRVYYRLGYRKFAGVVESEAYLDKTELIKEFLKKENVLVTAPRNFGKSINMDMLREFYAIKTYSDGSRIPPRERSNYKVFTRRYNMASGKGYLDIYKTEFFEKYFGRYPVIYVNFKLLNGVRWKVFQKGFTDMLEGIFRKHSYLLDSKTLTDEGRKVYSKFYTDDKNPLNPDFLQKSLYFLSAMLYRHYRRRCIVLIDEIDTPSMKAIFRYGSDYMVYRMTKFIQRFVSSLLVGNRFVSRGFISGNTRVAGLLVRIMSGERYYFHTDHEFRKFFGATESELTDLATKFKADRALLTEWYGGNRVQDNRDRTHNIFSVVSYLKNRTHLSFYRDPKFDLNVTALCATEKVYNKFMELLHKGHVKVIYNDELDIEQTMFIRDIVNCKMKKLQLYKNMDLLFNFMLDLGYLTIIGKSQNIRSSEETSSILVKKHDLYHLAVTNKEIKTDLLQRLHTKEFLFKKFKLETRDIDAFIESVLRLSSDDAGYLRFGKSVLGLFNATEFPKSLKHLMHPIVASAFYKSQTFHRVHSQLFAGKDNLVDLLIVRKDLTGVMIQFDNKKSSYSALKEIINKEKYRAFKIRGMHVDVDICIGFYLDRKGKCLLSYLYDTKDLNRTRNLIIWKNTKRAQNVEIES